MSRRTRIKAQDFMWRDAAYVCGISGQQEQSDKQSKLAQLLDSIASDSRVPLDIVEQLGELVRLAHDVGRELTEQ